MNKNHFRFVFQSVQVQLVSLKLMQYEAWCRVAFCSQTEGLDQSISWIAAVETRVLVTQAFESIKFLLKVK